MQLPSFPSHSTDPRTTQHPPSAAGSCGPTWERCSEGRWSQKAARMLHLPRKIIARGVKRCRQRRVFGEAEGPPQAAMAPNVWEGRGGPCSRGCTGPWHSSPYPVQSWRPEPWAEAALGRVGRVQLPILMPWGELGLSPMAEGYRDEVTCPGTHGARSGPQAPPRCPRPPPLQRSPHCSPRRCREGAPPLHTHQIAMCRWHIVPSNTHSKPSLLA